jgi:maltose alpha-D-glucosyltransferase / alpha-amylase
MKPGETDVPVEAEELAAPSGEGAGPIPVDSTWYKDAVVYELHVRSYADSTGDGTGDFTGLSAKLDYLRDLGITAVWLLPFYPSPLRDDGYDISDYTDVHPNYGSLADFRSFLRAAHARGIRVINELVLNHTSDQHPWFQRARRAPVGSIERDYYIWSDTPARFEQARIIFSDTERSNWTWDPVANAYYFHRFYSSQPDLNYDLPAVRRAVIRTVDFWFGMGVDGLRLDAVPYLFKRDGSNCENLPETHEFLKALRAQVDRRFPGRMLLAEANQWPEDAAHYFGAGRGDECHTAFHFPLMPRLFMAVRMGNRFPIVDMLNQTPKIPEDSQWLIFLRNHDELTLEMVSDEERDFMYRAYARDARMRLNVGIRRRLAPLLRNDRRVIELMNSLLFSLPGTPVIYYGDEIGMGDNIYLGDRDGVRTPMQWSPDRNAGFSRVNPQRLYLPVVIDPEYHFEAVNVEAQQSNSQSLLWFMKRLIALRRQTPALGRGDFTGLLPENNQILAYLREYRGERVLVVANLSNFAQWVRLDLRAFQGVVPVEMFGHTPFPVITEAPFQLSLGPYGYFWFELKSPDRTGAGEAAAASEPLALAGRSDWKSLEQPVVRAEIERSLPGFLESQRWFRGKDLFVDSVRWIRTLPLGSASASPRLAFVRVRFTDAESQTYLLPLGLRSPAPASPGTVGSARNVLAVFRDARGERERNLEDVAQAPEFVRHLISMIGRGRRVRDRDRGITTVRTDEFRLDADAVAELPITPLGSDHSNTSAKIGDVYVLKLFRMVEAGSNPETELGQFLLAHGPAPVAPLAGQVDLTGPQGETYTIASLHRFIPHEGTVWGFTLDHLRGFFEWARAHYTGAVALPVAVAPWGAAPSGPSDAAAERMAGYLGLMERLGARVAELHLALAKGSSDPAFAPEPFDERYVRSIYQTMQTERQQVFDHLRSSRLRLPSAVGALIEDVVSQEPEIDRRFRSLLEHRFAGQRIRIHGDLHLDQVLWTGKDFTIIDLEGEPLRSLTERRLKRSPLRDVAGMLRSFDYAARVAAREIPVATGAVEGDRAELQPLADVWVGWTSTAFLRGYRAATADASFRPHDPGEFSTLLGAYLLEKAIYEAGYELTNRPTWLPVPLRGLAHLLALRW